MSSVDLKTMEHLQAVETSLIDTDYLDNAMPTMVLVLVVSFFLDTILPIDQSLSLLQWLNVRAHSCCSLSHLLMYSRLNPLIVGLLLRAPASRCIRRGFLLNILFLNVIIYPLLFSSLLTFFISSVLRPSFASTPMLFWVTHLIARAVITLTVFTVT